MNNSTLLGVFFVHFLFFFWGGIPCCFCSHHINDFLLEDSLWGHNRVRFAYQFGSGTISVPQQNEVRSVNQFPFAAIVEERCDFLDDGLIDFSEIFRLGRLLHQINE